MINKGTIVDHRYEILREIDRGGMSIIYLAHDNRLRKQVVLKDIRKENKINNEILLKCLKAEADLLISFDHPNLPKIYDIIEGNGHIYVVMDYIEGESLKKKFDREGKCSVEEVVNWGKQLADILEYLHTRKPYPIIYSDMKPHNIMLTPEGKIKLIDFGISVTSETKKNAPNFGTEAYAAPEQLSNRQTDRRTDIYSLGVTLYQLVTGLNFKENTKLRSIRQMDTSLPEGLEYIIEKCLNENPEDRYQTCNELLYDLENVDKLTKGYKRKLIGKISLFSLSLVMFIISLIVTLIFFENIKTIKGGGVLFSLGILCTIAVFSVIIIIFLKYKVANIFYDITGLGLKKSIKNRDKNNLNRINLENQSSEGRREIQIKIRKDMTDFLEVGEIVLLDSNNGECNLDEKVEFLDSEETTLLDDEETTLFYNDDTGVFDEYKNVSIEDINSGFSSTFINELDICITHIDAEI